MADEMTPEEREMFEGIQAGMGFGKAPANDSPYEEQTNAYGSTVHKSKTGLTRRGKVAIAVGTLALVGGGTIWFQAHSAAVAKDEKEAAALQIQMKKLELEEMRIRNEQATAKKKEATTAQAALQKKVDQCVEDGSKAPSDDSWGNRKSDVISDCKALYGASDSSPDMEAAGNAEDTGGGGLNSSATLGIVAGLGLGVAVFAKRGQRSTTS